MGYYIETPMNHGKARYIVQHYNGVVATYEEAKVASTDQGVIVVLDNGPFEAAGFAYDESEFEAFTSDGRPKSFVILERSLAERLTGFSK